MFVKSVVYVIFECVNAEKTTTHNVILGYLHTVNILHSYYILKHREQIVFGTFNLLFLFYTRKVTQIIQMNRQRQTDRD